MSEPTNNWAAANQRYLSGALAELRHILAARAAQLAGAPVPPADDPPPENDALDPPPAIEALCALFGLSGFERAILLLCAGCELEAGFAQLCGAASGNPAAAYPSFSLALAALPTPHWSALLPAAPLRRWRLIEVAPGQALTESPLRIDERVLHELVGAHYLDDRLPGFVAPAGEPGELAPSQRALAEQIARLWAEAPGPQLPAVQLCGGDSAGKRAVAAAACTMLGLELGIMPAESIPLDPREHEALTRLWEREAALSGRALLVDCDALDAGDPARERAIARLAEATSSALVLAGRDRRSMPGRTLVTFEPQPLSAAEQRTLWQGALGPAAAQLNGQVAALVGQFSLGAPDIQAICAGLAPALGDATPAPELRAALWDACRRQARPRLDDLAQRIVPAAGWADLVLPPNQAQLLRDIAAHVRQRLRVYEEWGFAAKSARGLGISALFAGPSGTGKTMAAEVLANELQLDLYKIDLSQVVSKYIGETEKNLRRVFDAAEAGGAILLFDEADALFGKRSDVKDSHDRYANIEVSYLLQRMESYRGLAILTTNLKSALDEAFLRRLRFVVPFLFPDAGLRAAIWRRVFPAATPTAGLEADKLARLNITGGTIRNIALGAAFLAADAGAPVGMAQLLRASQTEYAKLERALTEAETRGWV